MFPTRDQAYIYTYPCWKHFPDKCAYNYMICILLHATSSLLKVGTRQEFYIYEIQKGPEDFSSFRSECFLLAIDYELTKRIFFLFILFPWKMFWTKKAHFYLSEMWHSSLCIVNGSISECACFCLPEPPHPIIQDDYLQLSAYN